VHGYHPWAEDAEIYLPGVEKILNQQLFPVGAAFFESHARLTLFPNLLAALIKITHLPLETVLFAVHAISIFLLLLACWELSGRCFPDAKARWAGVALIAALLTLPVAGTALYLMDQYVNPRNLSAFAVIFAIDRVVGRKYLQAFLFFALAAAIHPFMSVFALFYSMVFVFLRLRAVGLAHFALLLPFGITFDAPTKAYHEAALLHPFHYLLRWQWYEWLGIVGPLAILWWFSRLARSRKWQNLDLLCRALIPYAVVATAAALALSIPARWESLARLQPMRSLYILYLLLVLFGGGFLAEYVLKNRVWRWLMLFVPLCAGMFLAQRALFPASAHIEWPGSAPRNPWVRTFLWIREHTPVNAVFALDPSYMNIDGEDANGFRAAAQRSRLADAGKDSGAVSMFPPLAEQWLRQVHAAAGWKQFRTADFQRLREAYGVDWLVIEQPGAGGVDCPYRNSVVLVCRNPAR